MEHKDREILLKILKHVNHAIEYSGAYNDINLFEKDDMCVEATIFNLMQIGKLAKTSLSNELKDELKAVPWKQIYGLRNRIVHGYDGVNLQIVWDVLKEDLPELKKEIKDYLNDNETH